MTSNASKTVTESVQCNKNTKHRSHIHFSSKQNVSKRMQMSPKTISLTYTAPAKYESPNSNKICAKIDLVPANRPVGLGNKIRNHGSPTNVTSTKCHVDSGDLENGGYGSTMSGNGGCKNTDKCHCFLGSVRTFNFLYVCLLSVLRLYIFSMYFLRKTSQLSIFDLLGFLQRHSFLQILGLENVISSSEKSIF